MVKLGYWVARAGLLMQSGKCDAPRYLRRETEKRYRQGLEINFRENMYQVWRKQGGN